MNQPARGPGCLWWEYPSSNGEPLYGSRLWSRQVRTPLTTRRRLPYLATYVDWHILLESQAPRTYITFCVFEQNEGPAPEATPLQMRFLTILSLVGSAGLQICVNLVQL